LKKVDGFLNKRQGLEKEISGLHNNEEYQKAQELKSEARNVEAEIEELETKLLELGNRHRYLSAEASKLENSVQSRASSYKASLSLLDTEERRFLRRPPIELPVPTYDSSLFATLNSNRRTLSIAKEHWHNEEDEIHKRLEDIEAERDALRDGGTVWEEVVNEVSTFETMLREEMRRLGSKRSGASRPDDSALKSILKHMDKSVEQLESQFTQAEDQDWKLLIVAIGAELEAFTEGRAVLQDALGISEEPTNPEADGSAKGESETGDVPPDDLFGGLGMGYDESPEVGTQSGLGRVSTRSDEENDEPDPDLLISHQD
jgi:hypothetical protein